MTDTYVHGTRRRHGTPSGYTAGCRDDCCADAMRAYKDTYKLRRAAQDLGADMDALGLAPIQSRAFRPRNGTEPLPFETDEDHGLRGYRTGCKCAVCMAAGAAWASEFNLKSVI